MPLTSLQGILSRPVDLEQTVAILFLRGRHGAGGQPWSHGSRLWESQGGRRGCLIAVGRTHVCVAVGSVLGCLHSCSLCQLPPGTCALLPGIKSFAGCRHGLRADNASSHAFNVVYMNEPGQELSYPDNFMFETILIVWQPYP